MASEEPLSPHSSGKHRRSPADDEGAEEAEAAASSSKRRKHHHHHHRHHRNHHHHRPHRQQDRDWDEGEGGPAAKEPEVGLSAALVKPGDDDREEGEILEEEEEEGGEVNREKSRGLVAGGGSDVESGEIKPEGADAFSNRVAGEQDTLLVRSSTVPDLNEDAFLDENLNADALPQENFSGKDEAWLKGRPSNGENHVRETGIVVLSDAEFGAESGDEKRRRRTKSPQKGAEKEKKHKVISVSDLKSRVRSRSPVSRESSHAAKQRRKDDLDSRHSDRKADRHEPRRHLVSENVDRDGKNRSNSPNCLPRGYKESGRSPSCARHHEEAHHWDNSRSHAHISEIPNERGLELYADVSAGAHRFDSVGNLRSDSGTQHRLDRHGVSSQASDKEAHRERESSSSYTRHDVREDRHRSHERDRERERYSSNHRGRDNMEVHKGTHRDRERSSSYSRHDRLEERHSSRDRGRKAERYSRSIRDRDREKPRDVSRERYRERERVRDSERERDRDRTRARDREMDMRKDKEQSGSSRDRHRDSRLPKYDEVERHKDRTRSRELQKEAGFDKHNGEDGKEKLIREEDEEDYQERIEQQLAKQHEEDVDKIKEESRKRRQAILEKYKQRQLQQQVESSSNGNKKEEKALDKNELQDLNASNAGNQVAREETENKHDSSDVYVADPSFTVGKSPMQNGVSTDEKASGARGLGEGTPKSERSADMFCDDIFGESPTGVRQTGKGGILQIERSGLHDNWDDAEGYYSYRFGELLDGRYEIIAAHGKGVFSTVVRAKDLKAGKGDPEEVAIKIIRNNETMFKAGQEEFIILKKLAGADPEDKRHCVRFLSSFKYRNHLCLVFESLHMNLREVLKKFGRNIGLKLTAVRAYAKQLFIALKHLRNCGILHCDIKPDNMLVNEAKNMLKLCDFGNAMFAGKNEITPYLVSRFYRAPEIILGLPYDHPLDMWSVGCCLFELYTGKVLFPGPSNNDMLRLHMELKGPFPKKMLRKGAFTDQHFDQDLNFHATEEDPVTKKTVKRLLLNIKPKDIGALISGSPGEDPKMLSNFKDLLERIFVLDPEKRLTVSHALSHPFITGK